MLEYVHTINKTGEQFSHPLPESYDELVGEVGDEGAFAMAIHGYRISCNGKDRNAGKESKTKLTKEAIGKLKQLDAKLIEKAGLTEILAKL